MLISARDVRNSTTSLIKSIRDLCSSPNPESDFEKLITEIERENQLLDEDLTEEQIAEIDIVEIEGTEELPALRSLQALKTVDELVQAGITSDEETIEFLVANRISGLWQDTLNNGGAVSIEELRGEQGGVYFETIRSRFLSQYDSAQSLEIPRGYDFRVGGKIAQPNLMQKLAAYRVLSEKRLGNWSGVGAGKTLSAILASRVIDARLTVIIAFNSTVEPWAQRVKETYPDSKIHIKERGDVSIDPSRHTYLILNFETFQQPDSAAMVAQLVEKHKIDFVVLDEIQSVKQRTPKVTSKRRQVVSGLLSSASEKNPDLRVLGMSATPVINNLYEAKALLELVRGVSFDELETFSNIPNAIAMHEKLILYGIRYRPEYKQTIETEFIEIPANEYLPKLTRVRKGAILDLERVLLDAKMETLLSALKPGTLIYTHYLGGLITPLREAIGSAGFKVGLFTGDDKSGLELFKKGKVDVLIGSVPVGTGVDGLQYVCNRMIILSLPWTNAEYEQLIGRLYRQGSAFDKVEVIVPQVVLEHNGDIWSWDKMRMNRIQYKKTLADAAMDGVIPEGELSSPEVMFKKAREALQTWIQRIEEDGIAVIDRAQLKVPMPKDTAAIIQRRFGDLSVMNSRFNTAYSSTTHERLNQNPEEWFLYHTLYREARKEWTEVPFERIAKSLKKRPDWVIGDFGCGEAKLASLLPNKVYSFDHIAINENVLACDITHVPVEDGALDVAVFSLSLMGLNYPDYLKEAYRALRFGGLLKIAEPISRWADKRPELLSAISEAGFSLVGKVEESNQFMYIDAIKM
ncbi:helicase-related protein [Candidatus Villigracilis saccharophilus]|uniref:helicase-related protein n=1 Tax=Candidatus Villigracilis saccharophilus TaxID=3140684 RepID=UPI0031359B2D|nr:methyltransferase domain-containing protein [Anaerolineales bacterium]